MFNMWQWYGSLQITTCFIRWFWCKNVSQGVWHIFLILHWQPCKLCLRWFFWSTMLLKKNRESYPPRKNRFWTESFCRSEKKLNHFFAFVHFPPPSLLPSLNWFLWGKLHLHTRTLTTFLSVSKLTHCNQFPFQQLKIKIKKHDTLRQAF